MKVKDLKEILENALDVLNAYEDEDNIKLQSNTYFLGNPNSFIGIAGYNGGYVALDWLENEITREDEEDSEEDY